MRGNIMDKNYSLGIRLRQLRKERKFTQRDLAGRAGLSVNAISLIERGEISPSVATLQSLAAALKVRMCYFFDEEVEARVTHLRVDARPSLASAGLIIQSMGQRLPDQQIEPFFITLQPGANSGDRPTVHTGHEFVYCLHGVVEYDVDGIVYRLVRGDTLLFDSTLPHHWHNSGPEQAELLLILESSPESSETVRRHFPDHPSLAHLG